MAIDTSIYGMIERPKIKSPMEMQADAYTLRNLGQENELRQQQIATAKAMEQQRVDKIQREQNFRAKLGQNASEQELYSADPEAAGNFYETQAKIGKEKQQMRAAELDAKTKDLEGRIKQSGYISQLAKAGTASPMAASRTLMQAVQEGLLDETQANQLLALPWEQQKQELEVFVKAGMSSQAQAEEEYKKLAEERAADKAAAELPGIKADSQGKVMTLAEREANKGLTAAQVAEQERAKDQQKFQSAENAKNRSVTMRGQNMTDARTRELTEATRQNKPLSEYETRNYGFFDRARQASEVLKGVEKSIADKGVVGQARIKFLPNVMQSEENQIFEQAKRQFIAAYLRRDSGAVITPSEIAEADRTLFVQPGDAPAVIEQKRKARETITNSLKVGAGRAPEKVDGSAPVSKLVKLIAPNGQTKEVPEAEAEHYLKLGAKRAN